MEKISNKKKRQTIEIGKMILEVRRKNGERIDLEEIGREAMLLADDYDDYDDIEVVGSTMDAITHRATEKLYAAASKMDFVIVALSAIVFLSSFFVPRAELAWGFSIVLLFTVFQKHPVCKAAAFTALAFYYIGITSSTYFLRVDQIYYSLLGFNKLFKYGFLLASILTSVACAVGVISGAKAFGTKSFGFVSASFLGASLSISFLDLVFTGYKYIQYPAVKHLSILLVDSAGFFLILSIAFSIWYGVGLFERKLFLKKKELESILNFAISPKLRTTGGRYRRRY